MDFKTFNQLIEYLKENFHKNDFIENHTRPQLAYILRKLYPHTTIQRPEVAFSSMCKKRQCKHIKFWLELHNENWRSLT